MPGKKVECEHCQMIMRSDNLKRHKKSCQGRDNAVGFPSHPISYNRGSTLFKSNQSTCSPLPDITKPEENSKVSAIIDAIINNGELTTAKKIPECKDRDESVEAEDGSLTAAELAEMIEDFEKFYSELIYKGRRENIPELMDILCAWREDGQITQDQYNKLCMKIYDTTDITNHSSTSADESDEDNYVDSVPHLSTEEKALLNKFRMLFHEMKNNCRVDNSENICKLLDVLKTCGTLDEEDCQIVFNRMRDIVNNRKTM